MSAPGRSFADEVAGVGIGGLTRAGLSDSLVELTYLERATAHVLAGWVARIIPLHDKVVAARAAHRHMQRANGLRRQVWALNRLEGNGILVPGGARTLMMLIDEAPGDAALFTVMDSFLRPRLRRLYRQLAERCDPLLHEGISGVCQAAIRELGMSLRPSSGGVRTRQDGFLERLEHLWDLRWEGEQLDLDEAVWSPRDRRPLPSRAAHLGFDEPGALRTIPIDANRSPRDIGIGLHRNLDGEYTTMELVARNSYEHPDMPWRFHVEALRHSSDEARHAIMVERLMEAYGVSYGDYPINTIGYESIYQFGGIEPGSRRELLWRLLLRQTFQEGMALDSLDFEIRRRRYLDQESYAEVFEFLLADEVFHAESGLRWSTYLLDGDAEAVRVERGVAVEAWGRDLDRRRLAFAQKYPERAWEEIEQLEAAAKHRDLPFEMTLNRRARLEAGFTDEDLDQIVAWGFVNRDPADS